MAEIPCIMMNYEISKLNIACPGISNFAILLLLVLCSFVTLRKQPSSFLSPVQTNQLKGAAILLVMVGHLWVHVSEAKAIPVVGDYSVCMFLLLSGFGLTVSLSRGTPSWSNFAFRRFYRVMIPYWIMTAGWLIADYFLLDRAYSKQEMIFTLLGVNISPALQHLDYTRWYITLLLPWYLAFCLAYMLFSRSTAIWSLSVFGVVLVILRVLKLFPLGDPFQLVAFPLGVLLGNFYKDISNWLSIGSNYIIITGLASGLLLVCAFFLVQLNPSLNHPSMLWYAANNFTGLVYCVVFIMGVAVLGRHGYVSTFLESWGKVSYEAYLIHGPLLIKYNPIIGLFPAYGIPAYLACFLGIVWLLSYLFHSAITGMVVSRSWHKIPTEVGSERATI